MHSQMMNDFWAKLLVNGGDYGPQTLDDTRSLEYSREETRVVDREAQVTSAVDRPLQHVRPWVFCDMLGVHSLAAEGFETPEGGNCVVHQLEVLACSNDKPMCIPSPSPKTCHYLPPFTFTHHIIDKFIRLTRPNTIAMTNSTRQL